MNKVLAAMSICLVPLAGCTGPTAPPRAVHAVPPGILASAPPGDTSFTPLRCVPTGPGVECRRHE